MSASGSSSSFRSLSEHSEVETIRISVDLVAASRRNLGFLRLVNDAHWLHHKSTLLESIRRYEQLWMPLMADLCMGSTSPMVLPPLDVEWVWFCHTLNSVSYKQYCESRFSKIIGKPPIFDEEIEEYAYNTCKEFWIKRYPSEPFENESDSITEDLTVNEDLLNEVLKHRHLYAKFTEPYQTEIVYLIAARQRYKAFLHLIHKFADEYSRLVPTSDVLLMWLTHQSYPSAYLSDIKELEEDINKVLGPWEAVNVEQVEETKKLWERTFNQPYEKAGGEAIERLAETKRPISWEVTDIDVNTKYKSLVPRFLLEASAKVKLTPETSTKQGDMSKEFLRLRVVRCHRELKLDKPLSNFTSPSFIKAWHLYCEFGTKGLVLELRQHGGRCFKGSSLLESVTFLWNDLLRAPSLTLSKEIDEKVNIVASITPPVQASYLLKCVPDRVTDDSGAMISDVILKLNQYRPQEGRWLSRTVLDHAGRECFVIRMRVGGGIWRRGGEVPSAVKWADRIVEIREGSWSYVAGSIGKAPEKVVATAEPKEPPEGWQASWHFSTGEELLIRRGSSTSSTSLSFDLKNQQSSDSVVKLLVGRRMQYQVKKSGLDANNNEHKHDEELDEVEEEEENGFVTLVRFTEDNSIGKATALLNWKLMVVELSPEEDAVLVLLICLSIVRSITEWTKEDVGSLLIRRRIREAKLGDRDWGSVVLHPSSYSSSISSPHLQPWYWNAEAVMAPQKIDQPTRPPTLTYSQAEGSDKLYKKGIIS